MNIMGKAIETDCCEEVDLIDYQEKHVRCRKKQGVRHQATMLTPSPCTNTNNRHIHVVYTNTCLCIYVLSRIHITIRSVHG